jgi:ADP-ribosylation factor 2-binding protein
MSSTVQDITFDDEDIVIGKSSNQADFKFDLVVGCIEEIIMEPKFQQIQDKFMEKNYKHFDESDENKLIYTTIHKEYTNLIEKYLESELKRRVEQFSMEEFMKTLVSRPNEAEGEIFEILQTFEDFLEFKDLMLSYKRSKEGKSIDLSFGLSIQSINLDSNRSSLNPGSSSNQSSNNTNGRNPNGKSKTPLLDKTHIDHMDSDHE